MNRITLISFVIFFLNVSSIFGQNQPDSIHIKKKLGTVFIQNNKKLTPKQLLDITKMDPEAYKEMKLAKLNYNIGNIFGCAGGFLVGWQLGTTIAGGKPNWTLAGIGAGLIVVSIPFSTLYTQHTKHAVGIYNNGLKQMGFRKIDFKIGLICNGIGIKTTF